MLLRTFGLELLPVLTQPFHHALNCKSPITLLLELNGQALRLPLILVETPDKLFLEITSHIPLNTIAREAMEQSFT